MNEYRKDLEMLTEWASRPYPKEIAITHLWREREAKFTERLKKTTNHRHAFLRAQIRASGYEMRDRFDMSLIGPKIEEIENALEDLPTDFLKPGDSEFSVDGSVDIYCDTLLSNTYLWHLYFYRALKQYIKPFPKRILELGGGYGGLARIIRLMEPDVEYTMTDIPTSLFHAFCFLKTHRLEEGMNFMPIQNFLSVEGDYDLIINTGSLGEIPEKTIMAYLENIQRLAPKHFYSFNYWEEVHNPRMEVTWAQAPTIEGYREVVRRMDPITVIEGQPRNRMELLQERL